MANLGDLRNPSLRQNVISGAITPSQIAVMTTEVCVCVGGGGGGGYLCTRLSKWMMSYWLNVLGTNGL